MVNWAWMLTVKRKTQGAGLLPGALADPLLGSSPKCDDTGSPFPQTPFRVLFPESGTQHPITAVCAKTYSLTPFPQREWGLACTVWMSGGRKGPSNY